MNDSNPSAQAPTVPENFPSGLQWQSWVRRDKRFLSWSWFADLEPGAWLNLLRDGKQPDDERDCIAIITACFSMGLPTVLKEFLTRSRHLVTRFRARTAGDWPGVLTPSFDQAMTLILVNELLIPQRHALRAFDIKGWNLSDSVSVKILCDGLGRCSRLEVFRVVKCNLNISNATRLLESVKESWPNLTDLSFSSNHVGDAMAGHIAARSKAMPLLKALHLRACSITGPGALSLAAALEHKPAMQSLDLSHNALDDAPGAALIAALRHCDSLTELGLSGCGLGHESAEELGKLLGSKVPLSVLHIGWNDLELPRSFSESLKKNTTLRSLRVEGSASAQHVVHIADALKINRSLRTLVLHHSNLNERGIIKALCALLPSSHLSDIDLGDGELDDAACADLLNALKKNSKLKTLILQGNRMKAGACDAAGALLKVNNTLKKLDVSSCQIDDLSLTALTRHLSRGTFKGLMRLNMSWNEIGNGGLPSLLRALDCQQTLVLCAIGHNPFDLASPQVREQFDQAIKKSSSLTSLDYHNFKGAKLHDWSTISQRLQANACLSNASTQEYLRELIDRFAFETLTIREVGEQIWEQLRDDPNVDDRYAHLRSILRLNEVCRGIAFGSGSHGFDLESAEERASALIEARHAEGLESPTADSMAHPTAPLHDQ